MQFARCRQATLLTVSHMEVKHSEGTKATQRELEWGTGGSGEVADCKFQQFKLRKPIKSSDNRAKGNIENPIWETQIKETVRKKR